MVQRPIQASFHVTHSLLHCICGVLADLGIWLLEGKGHEATQSDTHDREWKVNNKHGYGTEKLYSRKREMEKQPELVTGDQEEQVSVGI